MEDLNKMIHNLTNSMNGLMAKANLSAEQTKMVHDVMNNGKSALSLLSDVGLENSELEQRIKQAEEMNRQNNEILNILKDGINSNK